MVTPFQHAREKVFMAFTPKATKKLAKSNMWVDICILYTPLSVVVLTNIPRLQFNLH